MDSDYGAATGFVQQAPGGWVFEIGNGWLTRRIQCVGDRIGTTSLIHNLNAEEYLEETVEEFSLELFKDGRRVTLGFREFSYTGHETPKWDEEERQLRIRLRAVLDGAEIPLVVSYNAKAGGDHITKCIEVGQCDSDWTLEWVTIEHLRLKEMVEGVSPLPRYPNTFPNGEDDVHTDPDKASIESPRSRFTFSERSRAVVTYWGFNEGLYFFGRSLLGYEEFSRDSGLLIREKCFIRVSEGFRTGDAVIGTYAGHPEIGFKRYTEFLSRRCVIDQKTIPVEWNTWFVTRGRTPVLTDCDRNLLLEQIPRIREADFYDVLHLDLGWEARKPMLADPRKFPNGLGEIIRKAAECGLSMAYWINPFSSNYWRSEIEEEHPEWLNPAKVSGQSGAHAICPMTEYFDYVRECLTELVRTYNARLILWDGSDWNIPYCTSTEHDHASQHELEVRATERLTDLCLNLRDERDDVIIAVFSPPFDNHRLEIVDQQQVSDTYTFPTGQAELIQRQQMYQMTWEHPYRAIRSSWHGVDWHQASDQHLSARPFSELRFAVMSMIGNGANQAAGSIDLTSAPEQLVRFLKRMFAWRKRFERYFTVYQHVLGFPDGVNVDGEAHIIDDKGFLVLINPSDAPQTINLPLDEPELELPADKAYRIYDWSDFDTGRYLGKAKLAERFEIELVGMEVRIIGVDVASFEEESRRRARAAIGSGHADVTDLSTRHDDYLAEAIIDTDAPPC